MSDFRTPIAAQPAKVGIGYHDVILCTGSCFAVHIGKRLKQNKFECLLNPNGILYNPASVHMALHRLLTNQPYEEKELFQYQGLWHSFAHHGSFSHPSKEACLLHINSHHQEGRQFLQKANRLILTLGTAHVFTYKKTGMVVANCHKVPGSEFERKRLSATEITTILSEIFKQLHTFNPDLQVIATVSPVRHLRDGLVENQRSKAALLLALAETEDHFDFVHYYPAYEIVMDDLRDYRFYSADMIHPNEVAVDYIWKHFQETYFSKETKELVNQIAAIHKAQAHRPLHPNRPEHLRFLKEQLTRINEMALAYPHLDFSAEKMAFSD